MRQRPPCQTLAAQIPSDRGRPTRRSILKGGIAAVTTMAVAEGKAASRARSEVGADGVWRWSDGHEVALFGVNYDLASASAFRFAKAAGVPFGQMIDADFAHFRRLGLTALRLCFWGDWENTTPDGTLVENEHLDVLDLILAKADAAGLSCLLSPFVTYDASWPDAMERPRHGISGAFKKEEFGTNPAAIAAQVRYLGQLLNRTNKQTGRRYADDPAIVALEPINEPWHHADDQAGSVRYLNALAHAVRGAGFTGPVFYNVTQDMKIAPAIAEADVQGATFAWYPTGLSNGREVTGNGLLLVDDYEQFHDPALKSRAKLVYEFDAADSMRSYFYPAMMRCFRSGGAQFAAMFAYDSLPIAASNSEFQDHFLNLAYTPGKALSALIAGVAMRELPRGGAYGTYPANMRFGNFRVDDRADLSEFEDAKRFYHSNDTVTVPRHLATIDHFAGCGSSPVISYAGTGAWFLDRVAPGTWRLEVYPDAAVIDNPFVFRRPSRPAVRIVHRERRFQARLPDLGETFLVAKADGSSVGTAKGGAIDLKPGVYRLSRGPSAHEVDGTFHIPASENFAPVLQHQPPATLRTGFDWPVRLTVVAPNAPSAVSLQLRTKHGFTEVPLTAGHGFDYHGVVPRSSIELGFLDYYVQLQTDRGRLTFPEVQGTNPGDWDFPKHGGYRVPVVPATAPLTLFDAAVDGDAVIFPYGGYATVTGSEITSDSEGRTVLRLDGTALKSATHNDLPAQYSWNGAVDLQGRGPSVFDAVIVEGKSALPTPGRVMVVLIERDGAAWGHIVSLAPKRDRAIVPLAEFVPAQAAMLPRDFPMGINPYWLRDPRLAGSKRVPNVENLQAVQFTLGQRFLGEDKPIVEISRISLLQRTEGLT